ncbi:MAG: glyoxalase superfamily protein [Bacteroidota bacterium]
MENKQHTVIPLLRIFDIAKAKEFYIDWLGFTPDWEHRFGEHFPVYMQVSKDNIRLHLTEHHGDCCPGAKLYIEYAGGVTRYQAWLTAKDYRYNKPGLQKTPWNVLTLEVIDPFGNKLVFAEEIKQQI